MTVSFIVQRDVALVGGAHGETIGGSTCRCVGAGDECDYSSQDDARFSSASSSDKRIAALIIGLHSDRTQGEVAAVDGDNGSLRKASARVVCLDGWVNGHDANANQEDEVHGNGSLVHATSAIGEEDVHDNGHGKGTQVHAQSGTDQNATPETGIGVFDLLDTELCKGVCQIHQQDQSQKQEENGAYKCNIVAPDLEETVWDQEAEHNQAQPDDNLGSPEAILQRGSGVLGGVDTDQQDGQYEVEQAQRKVDAMHGGKAKAFVSEAVHHDIIQQNVLQLLDGPFGEHDPRQQRVEEEDGGVGDSSGDTVVTLAAG